MILYGSVDYDWSPLVKLFYPALCDLSTDKGGKINFSII